MHYDQSWMSTGLMGGIQAGVVSMLVAFVLFTLFHWLGRRNDWNYGPQIGWSLLLTLLLTVSGDLWDMFYLNYARLQSHSLLQAQLATIHDPANLGVRVLCELLGMVVGLYLGWELCDHHWRRFLRGSPGNK